MYLILDLTPITTCDIRMVIVYLVLISLDISEYHILKLLLFICKSKLQISCKLYKYNYLISKYSRYVFTLMIYEMMLKIDG